MSLNQILDLAFGAFTIYALVNEINSPIKTKNIKLGIVSDAVFLISMIMDFFSIFPTFDMILMIISIIIGFDSFTKMNKG